MQLFNSAVKYFKVWGGGAGRGTSQSGCTLFKLCVCFSRFHPNNSLLRLGDKNFQNIY